MVASTGGGIDNTEEERGTRGVPTMSWQLYFKGKQEEFDENEDQIKAGSSVPSIVEAPECLLIPELRLD